MKLQALKWWRRVRGRSVNRSVGTFLVFVLIAFGLWAVLSLNEEQQRDLRYRVEVTGVPDSLTYVTDIPRHITANVRGSGSALLRYDMRTDPVLVVDYQRFGTDGRLRVSPADLRTLITKALGGNVRVQNVSPDSLTQVYTDHPGVTLPVKVMAEARPSAGHVMRGAVSPDIDSVTVFSLRPLPSNVTSVATEPIAFDNLTGSMTRRVRLLAPKGTRVIPPTLRLTAEAEPLIFKRRRVNIDVVNTPDEMMMVTFPAQVEVSYFVPRSIYAMVRPDFHVQADYADTHHDNPEADSQRVPLHLTGVPSALQRVSLSHDSVQYVLEHK